ncbi:NAD-P-binding protein [Amylostereum chailletii]|nr:NAD-P-binding protein [Amylostereum chailletii]
MSSLPGVKLAQYTRNWVPPVQNQEEAPGKQHKLTGPDAEPLEDITNDGKIYKHARKLEDKIALVTGADSGIGRSVALLYALEGADLTMSFLPGEEKDGREAIDLIVKKTQERTGRKPNINVVVTDLTSEDQCHALIDAHIKHFNGRLDVLALNQGTQMAVTDLTKLPSSQWRDTFDTNIHSNFYITQASLEHIPRGGSIIFNGSVNPFVGHPELVDYTATKGAILGFTRALSNQIVGERGIRVNMVAPGPVWTPLIPATMTQESKESFGKTTPIGRPGQPVEIATCFVFLASADSGYMSGQTLHPNGGVVIS